MIRELNEKDRDQCLLFVKEKPAENLFIIGDVEAFGFNEEFQDLWADVDETGKFKAVMLRYRENYIIFAAGEYEAAGFAALIAHDKQPGKMISGIAGIVSQVVTHMPVPPLKSKELFYAKCEDLQEMNVPDVEIKNAGVEDVPRLIKLYRQIPEFDKHDDRADGLIRNMEEGVSRCYYIEDGNQMVSSAMTTAENSMSAMVIGVCTLDAYKKKGYATACMIKVCAELLKEGKYLCLFYDNPEAGTIYKKLGFEDIGKWVMHTY
jgi:uncharacterized protein